MTSPSTPANPADSQGHRPVPDPTVLTTDQLLREIAHLKELFAEQFSSVDDKLQLAERQRVEQKSDTEKAIQAALLAQKESVAAQADAFEKSVAKSEAATTKQLDQLQATNEAKIESVNKGLDEFGKTVIRMQSEITGAKEQKVEQRAVTSGQVALIGLGITILLALITIGGFVIANLNP